MDVRRTVSGRWLRTHLPESAASTAGMLTAAWARRRRRRACNSDPLWVKLTLSAILAVAAISYSWGIQPGALALFYSGAVRSMSGSWHEFFFGGLDPGGWFTLDKLPGAFWIQALAARLFGYSVWTLIGPQILESVLTVAVTFRAVRRYRSPSAALVSSAVVAVTPVSTALARGNVSDALSTLLLVLAADAALRAVVLGRFRSLLCAGCWIGLAFQAK